jgi:hypothetical protein
MIDLIKEDNPVVSYLKSLDSLAKGNNKESLREFEYHGVFDFLLKEGRIFKSEPLDEQEKIIVEQMLYNLRMEIGEPQYKECFKNCQSVVLNRLGDNFKYCEGYALSSVGIAIHHAFLTINDKVVDITWRNDEGEFLIGEKCSHYFGVSFNAKDVRKGVLKTEYYIPHLEGYWNNNALFKTKFNPENSYLK